jgi:Ni,Fe-hydrogenase III small subunit
MLKLFSKILSTPKTTLDLPALECAENIQEVGEKLAREVKLLFRRSLAIRAVDAGSTNSCEQELTALSNPIYDIERFGIHFVASPRHADMLMVTGPVSRNMKEALIKTYQATPDPKIVVAVGDDAIDGGIFKDSYAVLGGVHRVIPVDFQIPGDPPSPRTILCHLLQILEVLGRGTGGKKKS